MNREPNKKSAQVPAPTQNDSARPPVVIFIAVIGLVFVGGLAIFHRGHSVSATEAVTEQTAVSPSDSHPQAEPPATSSKLPPLPAFSPAPASVQETDARAVAAALAAPSVQRPEPSAYTRSLVQHLSEIPTTPDQLAIWKQNYASLVHEGAAAIPAIRELLEKKTDVALAADQFGFPSLRQAMFSAMQQIGGQDAIDLALQVMQNPYQPGEISQLASQLETLAPGQYNAAIFAAADSALHSAIQSPNVDLSSLFQVLQKYGGANAAADLQLAATKWNYYSPLALAALPDGGGVSALTTMAENSEGSYANSRSFSFQMLAQLATQNSDAAQALMNLINNNQVPPNAWRGIAAALGGDQMFYSGTTPPPGGTDPKSSHIAANDQNFSSFNYAATWTPQQLQNQLALIDKFIAANPQAQTQLAPLRSSLAARSGQ